jgi:hypothetical protein
MSPYSFRWFLLPIGNMKLFLSKVSASIHFVMAINKAVRTYNKI